MSRAVSVRIAHKSARQSAGQRRHDTRTGRQPAYVDAARIEQNSVLIEPRPEKALRTECEARRRAARPDLRAMPSNAAVATVGIITFGHEAKPVIEALPVAEQDRLFQATAERIADLCNTSLTGLVVHRDESAVHAHFQMPAYDRQGRPLTATVKRATTAAMQDVAAEVWRGHGIERGMRKADRIAAGQPRSAWVNRSVRELHTDLPAEIELARASLEKNQRLAEQVTAKIEAGQGDLAKLHKRAETYQRRIEAARAKLEGALPRPVMIERVIKREPGGLFRRERVETKQVRAYSPQAVEAMAVRVGDAAAKREQEADARERRAAAAEKRLREQAEEVQRQRQDAKASEEWLRRLGRVLHGADPAILALVADLPGETGQVVRQGLNEAQRAAERPQEPLMGLGQGDSLLDAAKRDLSRFAAPSPQERQGPSRDRGMSL